MKVKVPTLTQTPSPPAAHAVKAAGDSLANEGPDSIVQRQLSETVNRSTRYLRQRVFSEAVNNSPRMVTQRAKWQNLIGKSAQRKSEHKDDENALPAQLVADTASVPNRTGLPDALKNGVERLSGLSMDDVRVHYCSPKPAQLHAYAYTQGTAIHVAPGQEQHLAHEAWHVVQQKQGRVNPTRQMKPRVSINDDAGLEQEADVMGAKAAHAGASTAAALQKQTLPAFGPTPQIIQRRHIGLFGLEAEVIGERFELITFEGEDDGKVLADPDVALEEYSLGTLSQAIDVTLDNEVQPPIEDGLIKRSYTIEFIQHPVDVLQDGDHLEATAAAWAQAGELWKAIHADRTKQIQHHIAASQGSVTATWEGDQFSAHDGNPTVAKENDNGKDTYHFDWNTLMNDVNVKSPDPTVSPQLTAGASLIALDKAFLATQHPLALGHALGPNDEKNLKVRAPADEAESAKLETLALIRLIARYISSTRPKPQSTKRYMKEYLPLMVRNSLDAVYGGMSPRGRRLFLQLAIQYLNNKPSSIMLRTLGISPDAPIFDHSSSKEGHATTITVEDLLFSIFKIKKGTNPGTYERDDEAPQGDIFAQHGLAGISEINSRDPDSMEKFHIDAPDEMMKGIKGVIFENRLAKSIPLSQMPVLFAESAKALKAVELLFEQSQAENRYIEDSHKARSMEFGYRY